MQYPAIQQECSIDLLHSLCAGNQRSCNYIAVPANVFGGRVDDDVHAMCYGFLKEWGGPAVVDACDCSMTARDIDNRPEIERSKHHRTRILEPDNLRVWP